MPRSSGSRRPIWTEHSIRLDDDFRHSIGSDESESRRREERQVPGAIEVELIKSAVVHLGFQSPNGDEYLTSRNLVFRLFSSHPVVNELKGLARSKRWWLNLPAFNNVMTSRR